MKSSKGRKMMFCTYSSTQVTYLRLSTERPCDVMVDLIVDLIVSWTARAGPGPFWLTPADQ